jgi:hypothetical protein
VLIDQVFRLTSNLIPFGSHPANTLRAKVFVNDAKVTKPDVMASNGVIYVINRVLNPACIGTRHSSWRGEPAPGGPRPAPAHLEQ